MRRALMLSLVLLGCDDAPPETGTPLPTCTDCGPGAVLGGRLFAPSAGVSGGVANRKGTVALRMGARVAVFDDALVMKDWMAVDTDFLSFSLDDTDGLVVANGHLVPRHGIEDGPRSYSGAVTRYTPDLEAIWSNPFVRSSGGRVYASAANVVFGDFAYVDLRASDGGVVWHSEFPAANLAVTPDGTLLVGGGFTGSLDLGGATEPLTSTVSVAFVASLDPLTGEATWAQKLDPDGIGFSGVHGLAAGPANELAVAWSNWPEGEEWVTLFDANGNVRWSQRASLRSIQTDGERIIGIDTYGIAQYSATGLDWRTDPQCDLGQAGIGTPSREILALTGDYLVALVGCDSIESTEVTVTIGDVSYTGNGTAIVKLAR